MADPHLQIVGQISDQATDCLIDLVLAAFRCDRCGDVLAVQTHQLNRDEEVIVFCERCGFETPIELSGAAPAATEAAPNDPCPSGHPDAARRRDHNHFNEGGLIMSNDMPVSVLTDLVQLLRYIVESAETECVCDSEDDRCAGCLARHVSRHFDVITDDEYREWMETRCNRFD